MGQNSNLIIGIKRISKSYHISKDFNLNKFKPKFQTLHCNPTTERGAVELSQLSAHLLLPCKQIIIKTKVNNQDRLDHQILSTIYYIYKIHSPVCVCVCARVCKVGNSGENPLNPPPAFPLRLVRMRNNHLFYCLTLVLTQIALSFKQASSAPEAALVTDIPGFGGNFPSKHYSG